MTQLQELQVGSLVADFELPSTGDKQFKLSDHRGKAIVIYFYPKDNTPGCTLEGQQFRDNIATFNDHNTIIIGISRDTIRKHENFKTKHEFPFDLLADEQEVACSIFGVVQLKKNYGREYMGIVRSTFLIDENGILRNEWRKVKVKDHIAEVLAAVQAL